MKVAPDDDLSPAARIRQAALEGFATRGVEATSIRDVAKLAGVSPGLVQHHFKNKETLRRAVDEHVALIGARAIGGDDVALVSDAAQGIGDRLTQWMRHDPLSLRYVIRSVGEGEDSAMQIFDSFVKAGDTQLAKLDDAGLLRNDLDRRWAVLHVIIVNLATALLEPAISRHLGAPLSEPEQLLRWNHATTEMFRQGFFDPR